MKEPNRAEDFLTPLFEFRRGSGPEGEGVFDAVGGGKLGGVVLHLLKEVLPLKVGGESDGNPSRVNHGRGDKGGEELSHVGQESGQVVLNDSGWLE